MAGGILNNPQVQNAINYRPQQPQQPGQIPQTANVDFGFNPTQNVPFQPQQIPGMAPHVVAILDEFRRMNMGQPQYPLQPFNPRPYPGQGNDMAVVTRPYDPNAGIEPVQVQPPRPPVIQPGPGVFPRPQPQDSKRGLGGLQLDKFRSRIR